jgi:hypothetical protein
MRFAGRLAARLNAIGITTPLELRDADHRLIRERFALDRRNSDPGTSINFWNRISITDSNFALDSGQS